jgi:hypothetical protein
MAIKAIAIVRDIRPTVGDLTRFDLWIRYVPVDGLDHQNLYAEFWAERLDGTATGANMMTQIQNAVQADCTTTFGIPFTQSDSVRVLASF